MPIRVYKIESGINHEFHHFNTGNLSNTLKNKNNDCSV